MTSREIPAAPALPEHSTDATGVLTGNTDLADDGTWTPWPGPSERPPLPGHEHQLDPAAKAWPWLTERRAFAIAGLLAAIGLALRTGQLL